MYGVYSLNLFMDSFSCYWVDTFNLYPKYLVVLNFDYVTLTIIRQCYNFLDMVLENVGTFFIIKNDTGWLPRILYTFSLKHLFNYLFILFLWPPIHQSILLFCPVRLYEFSFLKCVSLFGENWGEIQIFSSEEKCSRQ